MSRSKRPGPEFVAFTERVMERPTGRLVCVRVREVTVIRGDGNGSLIYIRGEEYPVEVTEGVDTVMGRMSG